MFSICKSEYVSFVALKFTDASMPIGTTIVFSFPARGGKALGGNVAYGLASSRTTQTFPK
jgi:hypothetical protein